MSYEPPTGWVEPVEQQYGSPLVYGLFHLRQDCERIRHPYGCGRLASPTAQRVVTSAQRLSIPSGPAQAYPPMAPLATAPGSTSRSGTEAAVTSVDPRRRRGGAATRAGSRSPGQRYPRDQECCGEPPRGCASLRPPSWHERKGLELTMAINANSAQCLSQRGGLRGISVPGGSEGVGGSEARRATSARVVLPVVVARGPSGDHGQVPP